MILNLTSFPIQGTCFSLLTYLLVKIILSKLKKDKKVKNNH